MAKQKTKVNPQTFEMVGVNSLHVHPANPRQGDVGAIYESIEHNGFYGAIIVQRSSGAILAGNHRYMAAVQSGITELPVLYVDVDDDRALRILLADNRTNDKASYDNSSLAEILSDLANTSDLLGTGYDGDDLDELIASLSAGEGAGESKEAPEAKLDKAEELRENWGTERGQVWKIGRHRLMCGDSTNAEDVARLIAGATPPTVVFDPPYDAPTEVLAVRWPCNDAIVFTDHRHTLDTIDGWPSFRCLFVWDGGSSWYTPGWPLARAKVCLWFGATPYDPDGSHYGEPGEARTVSNSRGAYAYHPDPRGKHLATVFASPATTQFDGHAHAKPVDWVRLLIANCTIGDVFDPFVGSGTTIVAAEQIGRSCYGMEIEPKYVAVTLERLSDMGIAPELIKDEVLT
jgi:hypothetical protein